LRESAGARELGTAADLAAVLDWRLDITGEHSSGIGPLRWLPSIPEPMAALEECGPYLADRDTLVSELADEIRQQVATWTPATAPAWAKPVLAADPLLAAEIAVFRAAHRVEAEDTRILGAPQYAVRHRKIQLLLEKCAVEAIAEHNPDTRRWERLIDHIDPRIRADAYWPQLAARLAEAAPSRPDLATLITTAAESGPLPDELPAAALWYRLDGELSPIATLDTTNAHLRPPWTQELHNIFGSAAAQAITAGAAWPALVAAITAADPRRWTPTDLLHVAAEQLADADPDRTIAAYQYARLITYTVDLLCTPHPAGAALPEHPPMSREEEELLPHDPEAPWIDMSAEPLSQSDIEHWLDQHDHPAPDAAAIAFDDLPRTRPAVPVVPVAVSNVYLLRDQYAAATADLAALERDVAIFGGPAMRAAATQITTMRARADADRPYLMAVQEVIAAWADADQAYDDDLKFHDWTRDQLAAVRADPDADELDITSARGMVELAAMRLGTTTPAKRYQPQLAAAHAARAEAAGGSQNIISGHDVDTFVAELHARDLESVKQARYDTQLVRKHLDAAERNVVAAFGDAETRTAEHVATQSASLATEMRTLDVAGQHQSSRALRIAPTATAGPSDTTAAALRSVAELPFAVSVVHAHPDAERTTALHILHSAATAAGRKVLWCSPTAEQAEAAKRDNLADGATTIDDAHAEFTSGSASAMPAGGLIIIDHAQSAQPEQIADLAEHAAQANAGLILIDTSTRTWPPQPADRMMKLLSAELPWTRALTSAPSVATSHAGAPDLDPVIAQLRRVTPDVLTGPLRGALEHADRVRAENLAAYRRHQDANWLRTRGHNQGLQRTQASTVDLT
ncbi:AAA family ATPase, partial [Mycolicibacterium llatzerense]|uniref:AAA family ATPase n=5 Tax=Mycobacteriaceae TaxID=1762 RepID=UPI0021B4F676